MANYFIADTHFFHEHVLVFDNRPFPDIETHDEVLKNNWNNVVNIDDDVYILGDISWANVTTTIALLKQLNGRLHLLIGNHDHRFLKNKQFRDCFVEIEYYKELDLNNGKKVILSHYPIPCFNNRYHGWYALYGHVHCSFEYDVMERVKRELEEIHPNKPCQMVNVGCMMPWMQYSPKTLDEIFEGYNKYVNENEKLGGE